MLTVVVIAGGYNAGLESWSFGLRCRSAVSACACLHSVHRAWDRERGVRLSAAPAREIDLDDGRLTPEPIEPIGRTSCGMHLLAHLKREELAAKSKEDAFKRAVEAGALAEARTFGDEDSNGED